MLASRPNSPSLIAAPVQARKVLRILCGLAVVSSYLVVASSPISAGVYNPIPADQFGDPQDQFVDDDALFAYATSDIKGGKICVVGQQIVHPSMASCGASPWGGENHVVGIGTQYVPIAGPPLAVGTWRLLSTDVKGNGLGISAPFTVRPCATCSDRIAREIVNQAKDAAREMRVATGVACVGLALKEVAGTGNAAKGHAKDLLEVADFAAIRGFRANLVIAGAGVGLAFLPGLENPGESKALQILNELTCSLYLMYSDIERDPPDPNYTSIHQPEFSTIPSLDDPTRDALTLALDRSRAFGRAMLVAFERYLGAAEADENRYVHAQALAAASFGSEHIQELRRSASVLLDYAALLDAQPEFADPVVTQPRLEDLLTLYARVRTQGFTADELSQLQNLGYSDAEIAAIRSHFDLDPSLISPGETLQGALRRVATAIDTQIPAFDLLAREASAVAGRTNVPPIASFTASTLTGPPPLQVTFTDTTESTDLDPLTVTWDFGDQTGRAEGPSVTHTYQSEGTFQVTETVCDALACSSATKVVFVGSPPPENQPPVAVDDAVETTVGAFVGFDVLANDPPDPDADVRTLVGFTQGANGSVDCGTNGTCFYTPEPGFVGTDSFEYTIGDGRGGTDSAVVTVTVNPAPNRFPEPQGDSLSVPQDTPGSLNVLANDSDPDGDALSVTGSSNGSNGTADCTISGVCTYTPAPGFVGPDQFSYTVSDARGGTNTGFVSVNVVSGPPPPNEPPVAVADAIDTPQDTQAQLNVLSNDSDPDQDALILTGISGDPGGTVTCTASGDCTYTPNPGESGVFSFVYTVSDGRGGSDTANVNITVRALVPGNRAPIAAFRVIPSGGFAPISVSFDASASTDPDGEIVEYLWKFGDGATGTGKIATHTYAQPGTYQVVLTVRDNDGLPDSAEFTYNVQDMAQLELPFCGDQDENNIIVRCPDFAPAQEVQLYQVVGSGPVDVTFDFIFREAGIDNELGVVRVDDASGTIENMHLSDPGYLQSAFGRARIVFPSGSNAFTPDATLTFTGGDVLMFFIVQGPLQSLLANNPDNLLDGSPNAFFSLDALNPDMSDHMLAYRHRTNGTSEFGWEDLPGLGGVGGDFNDIVYTVDADARPLAGVATSKAADAPQSSPGGRNGYTITANNAGPGPAVIDSVVDTLPSGFTYVPGSTSGDTSEDPILSGQTLTWKGPFTIDLGQKVQIHFDVTVSQIPGEYLNEATVNAGGYAVSPTGPTARIVVQTVDTRRPSCSVISRSPTELKIQFRDTGSGLREIVVTTMQNVTVDVPLFQQATTDPVVVTGTKVDPVQPSRFRLTATDMANNVARCTSTGSFHLP